MLDNETVALLGKLKLLAKKSGVNIDVIRMSSDAAYVESSLRELSNSDDPELVMSAIGLMNRFKLIKAPAIEGATSEGGDGGRYVGRLR